MHSSKLSTASSSSSLIAVRVLKLPRHEHQATFLTAFSTRQVHTIDFTRQDARACVLCMTIYRVHVYKITLP